MSEDKKVELTKADLRKPEPEKEEQKLVLSTKKSIHKPILIEVDGKSYPNNPLSRELFDEVRKHEKAALDGDIEALYQQVMLLFPVPKDVLNKLDVRDVNSLLEYTMARVWTPEKAKTDKEKAEKNGSKPGPEEPALSPASSQAS